VVQLLNRRVYAILPLNTYRKKPWRRNDMGREEEIRIIAYRIWEEEGCCHGRNEEHWLKAEMIWEEKQENEAASTGTKPKSKQTRKQGKKGRAASKKH
jgi:hypothetical protein